MPASPRLLLPALLLVSGSSCAPPGPAAPAASGVLIPTASSPVASVPTSQQPPAGWQASQSTRKTEPPSRLGSPRQQGSRLVLASGIHFEPGRPTLAESESLEALRQLKDFLEDSPHVTLLRIEGHTDSDGDDLMNLRLSGERALVVVDWLVARGIARDRLLATGFGEIKPLAPNDTPENKALNLRMEVHVAAISDKPYLGRDPSGGGTIFK